MVLTHVCVCRSSPLCFRRVRASVDCSKNDPGNLEQHKVEELLIEQVLILAADLFGAPRLGFRSVGVCASPEICEL